MVERDMDMETDEEKENDTTDDEEICKEQRNNFIDQDSKDREPLAVNINGTNCVICDVNKFSRIDRLSRSCSQNVGGSFS